MTARFLQCHSERIRIRSGLLPYNDIKRCEVREWLAVEYSEFMEFHDVQPAFARFNFGHIALIDPDLGSHVFLAQPRILARFAQSLKKQIVPRLVLVPFQKFPSSRNSR